MTAAASRPETSGRVDTRVDPLALRRLLVAAADAAVEELGPMPDTAIADLKLRLRELAARIGADAAGVAPVSASALSRDQINAFRARVLQRAAAETSPIDGRELARALSAL